MVRDPAVEAERVLRAVWDKIASGVPVDPIRIANEMGIDVFETDLEPDVSGAIVKEPGQDPTILLNRRDAANRQRFTVAHELGHYVVKSDRDDDYEFVDYRGVLASSGVDADEIFANNFAANLLMPKDEVLSWRGSGASVAELAYRFRVSDDAMRYRLVNLGLRGDSV